MPASRDSDVVVSDHWSIHIPAGSVGAADTNLRIAPMAQPVGPRGSSGLEAVRLVLAAGQPVHPWTFTWRFDQPLEQGRQLYLLDDFGDGSAYGALPTEPDAAAQAPVRTHVAQLSADRRSGTVTVEHLSFKEWLLDRASDLANLLGKFFDQRTSAPECKDKAGRRTQRPAWLSEANFLEDQSAPMLVCVGSDPDPSKKDLAEVDIANNRGGALLVKTPVKPTWAWSSNIGDAVADWVPNVMTLLAEAINVPPADAGRTWIVLPGQQVHFGFSQDSLSPAGLPAEITSSFTPSAIVFGLLYNQLSKAIDGDSVLWTYGALLACGQKTLIKEKESGIGQGLAAAAKCVIDDSDGVVQTVKKVLSPAAFDKLAPQLSKVAAVRAALTRVLLLAETGFVLLDSVFTLNLPAGAFTISLFLARTKVVTVVPVDRDISAQRGYAVTPGYNGVDSCTSSYASVGRDVVSCSPSAAGADVCWVKADRLTMLCGGMPWEKALMAVTASSPVARVPVARDPQPWGLELSDGAHCRLRNGGSWGGRSDGFVGAYFCDRPNEYVLGKQDPTPVVNKAAPTWTVLVGDLQNPDSVLPPPKRVRVLIAYFAGAA
ncbi:hypothetical protein [Amycolatopsis sp. NPDC059021]|uniref:hypothetical protein n=1 Tax=Amycolatopsis sp. NPDC059021 TaxID=3346704 RepID=UPI00366C61B4